jgi:hypothetical protein
MCMSVHQNVGQNLNIQYANKSFANVAELRYLGTTPIYKNCVHDEIKSRFNSENACYDSVQNRLPSYLLSRTAKIKICQIVILPVLCVCVKL